MTTVNTNSNRLPVHARMRAARTSQGLALEEVARRARLSLSTVRYAERGMLSPRTATRLARVLGIPVEDLQP